MSTQKIIRKVALAVIKDKKIMMVRSQDQAEVFYTLGGKREGSESDIECLRREVMEEISCTIDESSIKFLNEFEDIAHGRENTLVNIRLYSGNIIGEAVPSQEIAEIKYFDTTGNMEQLSFIIRTQIFPWLVTYRYIN